MPFLFSPNAERIAVDLLHEEAVSPRSVLLRLRARTPFGWQAGQHLSLFVADAAGIPYSIASAHDPLRPGEFELAVSSEASREMLARLRAGGALFVSPPRGEFMWRPSAHGSLFVGMGTGLSPLRAMLQAARRHEQPSRCTLLVGLRSLSDLWWRSEFESWSNSEASSFVFEPTLSRAPADWRGRQGRVQAHLAEIAAGSAGASAYVCGHPEMVSDCVRLLTSELGFARERVFSEAH